MAVAKEDDGGVPSEADYDSETFCDVAEDTCSADGQICYRFEENPGGGSVSFDNVAMAMLPVMQAITFDTWSEPMYDVMDAYSWWAWTYFIAAAILGGMFVVNLFLAVIFDEFMCAEETQCH